MFNSFAKWRRWERELATLRARIDALPSDFDKTSFLRAYCGELIPLGLVNLAALGEPVAQLYRDASFESFDPADFYPLFKNQLVSAECGMTCYFYIKLAQRLGFKAYEYSFGFTDAPYRRCLHSVALVKIVVEGRRRLIVQDPYLNLTYLDVQGSPIDFFDFLRAIQRRQYDLIRLGSTPLEASLLVPDFALYEGHLTAECREQMLHALRQPDGRLKTRIAVDRSFANLMQSPCDHLEDLFLDALRSHECPEPFLYAYTFPVSALKGSRDHARVEREIDCALRLHARTPRPINLHTDR